MHTEQPTEDLLTFEENYERAGTGKRLANYIIDQIVFYIIVFVFGMVLAVLAPDTAKSLFNNDGGFDLYNQVFSIVLYALYMSIVETIFKGKSIGKFITKTRAVNLDGSPISARIAFERGFSRAVPFCAFSALGTPPNPWQDRWTSTMVIEDKN